MFKIVEDPNTPENLVRMLIMKDDKEVHRVEAMFEEDELDPDDPIIPFEPDLAVDTYDMVQRMAEQWVLENSD